MSTLVIGATAVLAASSSSINNSLGAKLGQTRYAADADLNADGTVNILDLALSRLNNSKSQGVMGASMLSAALQGSESITIVPLVSSVGPDSTLSVMFLLQGNVTPLLGYSLDIEVIPGPTARGSVVPNISATNFFDAQNLIAGGCGTLDPVFSVILESAGGVFINAITSDNSTCVAVDGINDVLAQVVFDVSHVACGEFTIRLGDATALSDAAAFSVPFSFAEATVNVENCVSIPAVSEWGLLILGLMVLICGSQVILRRGRVANKAI